VPHPEPDRYEPIAVVGIGEPRAAQINEGAVLDPVATRPRLRRHQRARGNVGNVGLALQGREVLRVAVFHMDPDEAGAGVSASFLGSDLPNRPVADEERTAGHLR